MTLTIGSKIPKLEITTKTSEGLDIINTENYEINLKLYIEEGRAWMKKKYGFQTRWSMNQYTKLFYDKFFEYYPELAEYKI